MIAQFFIERPVLANVIAWRMQLFPVYLTIVPLFHCNGWTHTWMLPAVAGTLVCCRDITAKAIDTATQISQTVLNLRS